MESVETACAAVSQCLLLLFKLLHTFSVLPLTATSVPLRVNRFWLALRLTLSSEKGDPRTSNRASRQ